MTNERLTVFAKEKLEKTFQILSAKGEEYTQDRLNNNDRFSTFKSAAAIQGISPKEALVGMMAKQLATIIDMSKRPVKSSQLPLWSEKVSGTINYLVLLEALANEECALQAQTHTQNQIIQ